MKSHNNRTFTTKVENVNEFLTRNFKTVIHIHEQEIF